ncbi:MAG: hypothetical protein IJK67_05675 [Bacilli bacterium]|nr:hypothetical protein [Bacilli bacterium]
MEENNSKDKFIIFLLILFIIFLIVYLTKESGYYQYKAHNKAVLTEENIKRFEKDVEEGKNVTINDYVISDYVDYSNSITDLGYNIGKFTENIMNKGIKKTLKILSALFFD